MVDRVANQVSEPDELNSWQFQLTPYIYFSAVVAVCTRYGLLEYT